MARARSPRIRQSVAAMQADTAATLAEARILIRRLNALVEDLHDGLGITLEIAGKRMPIEIVIDPKKDA